MKLLDLTLPTPAENVALDEALLEQAEQGGGPGELLRLWELSSPAVVIGRSSRVAEEVNVAACQELGIPMVRRCSGGAAIVAGPGCLMYSVILSYARRPRLRMIDQAHRFVLGVVRNALTSLVPDVVMMGTSDLARHGYKFSGNSLRCKRACFLYHGTILYRFPLALIGQCLAAAPRQPDYRENRPHEAFVNNFPATAKQLRHVIRQHWSVQETISDWPRHQVARLVAERYARDDWNRRL